MDSPSYDATTDSQAFVGVGAAAGIGPIERGDVEPPTWSVEEAASISAWLQTFFAASSTD